LIAFILLTASTETRAQEVAPSQPAMTQDHELAKQLANPVANLISVPFQENVDFGNGPDDGWKSTLNIQPVIPVALTADWNVIIRTIVPIAYQHDVVPGSDEFGLGDTAQSFFFTPRQAKAGGVIWAIGPEFLYPTATDRYLGGKKWAAGPTALLLKQAGKNTFGMLANHIWSVAGSDNRSNISSTFLQPFFSHTTASALTIGLNTESTYDWKGRKWTVPINLTATQLTHMGKQRISVGGGVRYYASAPRDGPHWGVRLIFTLLYPQAPKK